MLSHDEQFDLSPLGRERIHLVRVTLRDAGFDEVNVLAVLDEARLPSVRLRRTSIVQYVERANGGGKLGALLKLFVLNVPVAADDFQAAIKPSEIEDWLLTGLVNVEGDEVYSTVELCPYGTMIAAADWPSEINERDDVMGIAASSRALLQMTVRRKVEDTFDLGCGCGIQSIVASEHCDSVLGTDINPRAVHFAEFNSILNGRRNTTFATAGLFDAANDKKFDLLVCNPPFVIGPRAFHTHTSTGTRADKFCESIIRSSPKYLTNGGFAQFVCNWAQIGDEAADLHIKHWVDENGCDTWVLHSHSESAEDYARARSKENASHPGEIDSLYDEWMAYFSNENITAVNFGVVSLRRSEHRPNWFRYDELPGASGQCGKSIERGFLLRDFLYEHSNYRDLLSTRFQAAPELEYPEDDLSTLRSKTRIRLSEGLTFAANLDPEIALVIRKCDGNVPLEQTIGEVVGRSRSSTDRVLPQFGKVVSALVNFGFLIPVDILPYLDK